jgi:hypothetical protein
MNGFGFSRLQELLSVGEELYENFPSALISFVKVVRRRRRTGFYWVRILSFVKVVKRRRAAANSIKVFLGFPWSQSKC